MSNNPYRDYYKAKSRNDEWSDVDAAEAKKRIEELESAESWSGERSNIHEEYNFSGGI
jgi:hypothetical protein